MSFLNPLVLFALAAAAIPLIIHLFNFRRPRKVDFSSLSFVKELQKSTMQRVKIKQWLLLLLRTLAIAFLVLAFARPTLTGDLVGTLGAQARSSVALVVDNSLSMTMRDAGGEYLSQAKDIAAGLVDALRAGDEVFLIPTSGERPARAPSYSNRSAALEAVEAVEPAIGATTLTSSLERAAEAVSRSGQLNKEIYVISDLQRSALRDSAAVNVPDDVRIYLMPIGDRTYTNVAITNVRIESRIIEIGEPMRLVATIVNHGTEVLDGYVASVYLEGERVAQSSADLEPGIPTDVHFTVTPQRRGWLSGIVRIEEDAFEFDNERFFTAHVPERRQILLVRGESQRLDFMRLALSPDLGRGRVSFDVSEISESDLSTAAFGRYDALILTGPSSLSSGEISALSRYVQGGGGLLFSPAANASQEDYNAFLEQIGAGVVQGWSGSPGSESPIAGFDRIDLEHPLFEGVFIQQGLRDTERIESPDIYRTINYAPSSGSEQTLIQLTNGFPFLQEVRHGLGIMLLMSVAPDPSWSDLPVRGLFVPLLYRSIFYLSASESPAGEQLEAARDGELRIAGVSESERLRMVGPDGTEYVPEHRALFGALLLNIEGGAIPSPGIYEVHNESELIRRVAVNLDTSESDLASFGDGEARDRISAAAERDVEIIEASGRDPADVVTAVAAQRTGLELWNVFLVLALLSLVAEMVVAKYWRPETVAA